MYMKKYKTIHEKKIRPYPIPSERELLEMAHSIIRIINRNPHIREEELANLPDTNIRFDLVGSPEVCFNVEIKKGKLKFLDDRTDTELAIGIHKELFMNLDKYPPTSGNMKILLNNIIFRKGPVRKFKQLKSGIGTILLSNYRKVSE